MRKLREKKHKSSKKFIRKKGENENRGGGGKERCIHIKKENETKRKKVQACPEQIKNHEFLLLNKDQVNTIKVKSMYFFEATSSFLHILRWDYHSATLEREQTGMERCQRPDKPVLVR